MKKNKIRICHIITRMDWGGSPDVVRLLCEGLARDDFEVTLIIGQTRHASQKTRDFLEHFPGKVVSIPELRREINPFVDLYALFALNRFLRHHDFDIVHTHTAKAGFLGRSAALLAGCRCIVHTPHGHNFYGYFGKTMSSLIVLLERLAGLYTAAMVVLTRLEKNDCCALGVVPEAKMRLIHPALEPEFFNADRSSREAMRQSLGLGSGRVIGMIARLEPVKGPRYFVEACAQLAGVLPDARFVVIGEGSLRKEMEDSVQRYGLAQRFLFTGWREDIPGILSCLDVMVQPSLNEALGLSLLQAQAKGVPIVATRVGGIAEAVVDGETAILVPPGDSSAIAQAVKKILEDTEFAAVMGKKAREWVAGQFTVERMLKSHEALYRELLQR
jgi:glycosyltransferase involved in cell wall biosynthesis